MGIAARISRHRSLTVLMFLAGIAAVWLTQRPAGAQKTDVTVFWPTPAKATVLNFERPAFRLGDRLAARGPLLDGARTSEVGYAYLDCVVMNQITDDPKGPGGLYWCTAVLRLADGDLTAEGLDPHGPGVYKFAVLGGTGSYAGASGEATLTDGAEGTEWVIDLS
jgi:hypothetical protein